MRVAVIAVCLAIACTFSSASMPQAKKKRMVLSYSLRKVRDPGVQNMPAFTYLMPKGWINEDQIQWAGGTQPYPIAMLITRSPDRQYGLGFYPAFFGNSWAGPAGSGGTRLNGAADAIRMMLTAAPQIRGYRVLDQMQQRVPSGYPASMGQVSADMVIQRCSFTENGKAKEGVIVCKFDNAIVGDYTSQSQTWMVTVLMMSSPPGKLFTNGQFLQQASAFFYSATMTPDYFRIVNKTTMDAAERNRQVALKQGEAIMKSYWDRQKKQDAANQNFSDYIRGVARHSAGNGGPSYVLPNGPNWWVDGNGNVMSSTDAGFNPNQSQSGNWQQLKTGGG